MNDPYLKTFKVKELILNHVSGPSPTCEERNIQDDEEWGLLKTTAVVWDGWNPNAHKVPPKEYWGKHQLEVQSGDVLVTKAGPRNRVGVVVYVDKTPKRLMVSGKMIGLKPNHNLVDFRALAAALSSESSQRYLDVRTTGMAEAQLNFTNQLLLDIEVHLPELKAQKKISSILNTIDNVIDQTQNLIDKYTAVKQGMMADLFSRGIDLSGTQETNNNYGQLRPSFEYAPELYQETKLGWIPKDWEIANLGEVADVIDPQPDHRTPPESENGIPYIGVGDFYWDQHIDRERCRKVIEAAYDKQRGRFQVELGDSIFGKIGTIGQPKQLKETEGFALSANILLIKAKEKNDYVFSFFDSVFFNKQLSNIINTTSQPALGIQTMRDILVVYPKCEKELHGITEKLKAINDSIVAYRKELHKYELIKKGLMQDLLTGKVKV